MFDKIRKLLTRKKQSNTFDDGETYYQLIQKRDKENSIRMQKLEDQKIERGIKQEALRWLNEYNNSPTIKIGDKEFKNCIHLMNPFIHAIMIYDEETSKYKNSDIHKLVQEEYQRLQSING
jgi:hypothetical protein